MPTIKSSLRECNILQRLILNEAQSTPTKDFRPNLSALSRAYVDLETLKLRIKMKGPPKPVDGTKERKRPNHSGIASPVDPSEVQAPPVQEPTPGL